jgi:dipeptidyl aminopeptidase/acylaminoacyl peptidase
LNLSVNGKTDSVRYGAILFRDKHASGVDLRRPVFLTAIGEWSKREGVARIDPRRPGAVRVLFEEARIKMGKAPGADVYFYSRETAFEFPDYYVANSNLASGVRVTRANSLQSGFAWSDSTQLLDFTSPAGTRLQAALHLPAGHDSAGRYPLLVFLDTAGSRALHSYLGNGRGTPFIPALYTSRGYAVLVPDIGIRVNDPGAAALESVTSALTAALATGTVDRERVAIVGHGWGGYLASFVLTQTERFSAAVLSAPVTNLVSLFSSESPNRSEAGAALDDRIARRFSSSFWDSSAVFVRNSPLAHAARMETPLLLVHNDEDELVPFTQGVELYNALRTLGKPVVLLQYQGERNSLELARNKVDFSLRMMQFLDHHLMGADAPAWWDFAPRR